MKTIRVKLINDAADEFERLNKVVGDEIKEGIKNSSHQQLLKSIKNKIDLIKSNPEYGDKISKKLIKKSKLDADNLWVVDLTGYWRMLYTLKGSQIEVLCFILEIFESVILLFKPL